MDSADFGVDFSADFGGLTDEIPFVELLAAPGGGDDLGDLPSLYSQPASLASTAPQPSAATPAMASTTVVQQHPQPRRSRRVRRRTDSASVAGDGTGSMDGEDESGLPPTTRQCVPRARRAAPAPHHRMNNLHALCLDRSGKSQMRRLSHNASEKRRALKINTHIDELREIVEVSTLPPCAGHDVPQMAQLRPTGPLGLAG